MPRPAWNSERTVCPGAFGAIMITSRSARGLMVWKWIEKPCAKASVAPLRILGSISFV